MNVPLLDLKAQYATIQGEVQSAITAVCDAQTFILGKAVEDFERQVAAYCGVKHAIGMSSGTDALLAALMVVGVGHGDEVICPPFTFFATAGTIARLGARPVFVDIEPKTFNINVERIEAAITPRTKAIMPVDLFGQAAEMDRIRQIGAKHKLPFIEDAAQAIGAVHHKRRVGQLASMTCFSFFPTKNLGAFGDGGMIVTDDDDLAKRARMTRVHGAEREYHHVFVGGNFRLDALQAAILSVKMRHLDQWIEQRQRNAARYDEYLAGTGVVVPITLPHNNHTYHQYTIRVPGGRRDALAEHLKQAGVGNKIYYPVSLHQQECFRPLGYRTGDLPVSEQAAAEVISLPIYAEMTAEQQQHVCSTISKFMRGA